MNIKNLKKDVLEKEAIRKLKDLAESYCKNWGIDCPSSIEFDKVNIDFLFERITIENWNITYYTNMEELITEIFSKLKETFEKIDNEIKEFIKSL